jgi:hypothetical protein
MRHAMAQYNSKATKPSPQPRRRLFRDLGRLAFWRADMGGAPRQLLAFSIPNVGSPTSQKKGEPGAKARNPTEGLKLLVAGITLIRVVFSRTRDRRKVEPACDTKRQDEPDQTGWRWQ